MALVPELVRMILEADHEIGWSGYEYDSDDGSLGRYDHYEPNSIEYEKDGWSIEVKYECCGEWVNDPGDYYNPPVCDLKSKWFRFVSIEAGYCDSETGEEYIFSDEELIPIARAITDKIE